MKKIIIQLLMVLALIGFSGVNAHATDCVWCKHQPNLSLTNTQSATSAQTQIQRDTEQREHADKLEEERARARDIAAYESDPLDAARKAAEDASAKETQRLADERKDVLENAQYVAKKFCGRSVSCRKKAIQQAMDQYDANSLPSLEELQYEEQMQALQLEYQQKLNMDDACIRGIAVC